jgi:hypothetical protein
VTRSILALVVVLAMAAAVGVVFAMICLAAWLRSVHGRGRLRCHQVRGGETKSRSNKMLLTMTGAAPQPIEAR